MNAACPKPFDLFLTARIVSHGVQSSCRVSLLTDSENLVMVDGDNFPMSTLSDFFPVQCEPRADLPSSLGLCSCIDGVKEGDLNHHS
eukprot:CCRYP_000014-RA/>CCRYP_000014-RA protein AED:0.44 eAED:0.75 QI:119/0/0.5/1/0/0/2/0/86